MKIYIGNLNIQVTTQQLTALFSAFGKVVSVQRNTDQFTQLPQGFAFVQMPDRNAALTAIETLHLTFFHQQVIRVSEARPGRPT